MGLALTDSTCDALLRYLDLLKRWNAVYNLTAVQGRDAMRTQHLLDCLAIVEPFRRMTAARKKPLPKRILDVGSGAGLPGVVLAMLLPEWTVVCADTVGKKTAFVRQIASELTVSNLQAVHTRVEALHAPPFGVVTSRAFSSLSQFVTAARQHLARSGLYLAMKGKLPEQEISDVALLPMKVRVFHVEPLSVPDLKAERCIVWMREAAASESA